MPLRVNKDEIQNWMKRPRFSPAARPTYGSHLYDTSARDIRPKPAGAHPQILLRHRQHPLFPLLASSRRAVGRRSRSRASSGSPLPPSVPVRIPTQPSPSSPPKSPTKPYDFSASRPNAGIGAVAQGFYFLRNLGHSQSTI
ncbi:hypothetical protein GUJ93_ZPchr0007g3807 [Zizania palustris]|uniref:Uncharacterized protein n=1 Tax=Zizania palustris TaxID=103762 RepID=A0A8J5VNN1_ZIZPA|nr:hypothetical protein GUJ93_ZPchr0007g3807 [Zizania palustris]